MIKLVVTLSLLGIPSARQLSLEEGDASEDWIAHRVVVSPGLKSVVSGKVHEVDRTSSWLLVHDALTSKYQFS